MLCPFCLTFVSLFIFCVLFSCILESPQRALSARRPSITQSTDANVFSVSKTQHHFSWAGQVFGTRSWVEPSRPLSLSLPLSFFLSVDSVLMFACRHANYKAFLPPHPNTPHTITTLGAITITLCLQSLCNFSLIPPSHCHFFSMNASVREDDVSPPVEAIFPYLRI